MLEDSPACISCDRSRSACVTSGLFRGVGSRECSSLTRVRLGLPERGQIHGRSRQMSPACSSVTACKPPGLAGPAPPEVLGIARYQDVVLLDHVLHQLPVLRPKRPRSRTQLDSTCPASIAS